MSTVWHPYTQPPEPFGIVRLRFGDDGERDTFGFYHDRHGCYYKSVTGMWQRASVHPTHWAEIEETQQ